MTKELEIPSNSVGYTTPKYMTIADETNPLSLVCGKTLNHVTLEYEQYGELNAERTNVILVLHALTGDAHAAGFDLSAKERGPQFAYRDGKPGWWDGIIGPGKSLDTSKYCVICVNVIGSCYGSTGPNTIDPETQKPYGLRFPMVMIPDWIECQKRLLKQLDIPKIFLAIGGSMGGQQALEWALSCPDMVERVAVIASAATLSPMMIGINAISRYAIFNDPDFNNGDYYDQEKKPSIGLNISRMLGHLTFLSHPSMWQKFGRSRRTDGQPLPYNWEIDFQVESYLHYQAEKFYQRFDPNSFLYFTKVLDYYDAAQAWGNGDLTEACRRIKSKILIVSYEGDWLYTPEDTRHLYDAMREANVDVTYVLDSSTYGHDAFLVETETLNRYVADFINK